MLIALLLDYLKRNMQIMTILRIVVLFCLKDKMEKSKM